jgi:hypothetical protein
MNREALQALLSDGDGDSDVPVTVTVTISRRDFDDLLQHLLREDRMGRPLVAVQDLLHVNL